VKSYETLSPNDLYIPKNFMKKYGRIKN